MAYENEDYSTYQRVTDKPLAKIQEARKVLMESAVAFAETRATNLLGNDTSGITRKKILEAEVVLAKLEQDYKVFQGDYDRAEDEFNEHCG